MLFKDQERARPNIPTASMGDIAFLIIIFFMTSTVFTRDKGIKMLLPEKTDQEAIVKVVPENIVMITINPQGEVNVKSSNLDRYLNAQQYDVVREIIAEKLRERDTLLVVSVRTSPDAPYWSMIGILDQIKLARARAADGREIEANKISLIPTQGQP
jgi:biopolymer transport protein ExbD